MVYGTRNPAKPFRAPGAGSGSAECTPLGLILVRFPSRPSSWGPRVESSASTTSGATGMRRTPLMAFLEAVAPALGGGSLALGITGAFADEAIADHVTWNNSLLAVAAGVQDLHPGVRSILEIGGHTAKFLVLAENGSLKDFATNEACAAGTGAFLEQQARRLGLSVQELAILAAQAQRGATIAGRCSVFANSDMIHLQQKGTPLPEIAYGLCVAIARNFLTTLLKGRGAPAPVLLAGGMRAEPRHPAGLPGGAGPRWRAVPPGFRPCGSGRGHRRGPAGPGAGETPGISMEQLRDLVPRILAGTRGTRGTLPILPRTPARLRQEEPMGGSMRDTEGYRGLDVGSVSTDLVLLDGEGEPARLGLPPHPGTALRGAPGGAGGAEGTLWWRPADPGVRGHREWTAPGGETGRGPMW